MELETVPSFPICYVAWSEFANSYVSIITMSTPLIPNS